MAVVETVSVTGRGAFYEIIRDFLMDKVGDRYVGPDNADILISAQADKIFSNEEIAQHKYILNVHFSDIEIIRGCNVMTHAIRLGLEETAITFHVIDSERIDAGLIVEKVSVPICKDDTSRSLYDKCCLIAFKEFVLRWSWLETMPEGRPPERLGAYHTRELSKKVFLDAETDRKVRSLMFDEEKRPIVVVGGKEYTLQEA